MATNSGDNAKSRYANSETGKVESVGRFLDFYEKRTVTGAEDDVIYTIPLEYENRPDRIANHFYNTPRYMWVILMRNNIENPLVELKAGRRLYIPSVTRLYSEILK